MATKTKKPKQSWKEFLEQQSVNPNLVVADSSESLDRSASPQVTLTFCRPEHEYELMQALNAAKYASALWGLDQWLRTAIKHGDDAVKAAHYRVVREKLHSCLDDEGVFLE
jgi:hypothetical protein